jgi:hypothetical protein
MYSYNQYQIEPHVVALDDGSGFVTDVIHVWRGGLGTEFFPRPAIAFPRKEEALAAAIRVGCEVVDRGYDTSYNPYVQ